MELGLTDEVVVVVGAARGIGRAIAEEFLCEGAHVVWLDRDPAVLACAAAATQSLQQTCPTVRSSVAYQVDACDSNQLATIAQAIYAERGRCDHVVVSIGCGSGKFGFPFWNLAPDDWDAVVRVNLIGAVRVAHAFVPRMLPARRGTLCFLSSVAGQIGSQTDPPYSAAKAGLINFAQCAAKDLAPYHIRVNVVSPGMVRTELNQSVWAAWRAASPEHELSYDAWAAEKLKVVTPLNRWQEPRDVAAMVTFLASSRAANVTGQTLNVDGGQVMHA